MVSSRPRDSPSLLDKNDQFVLGTICYILGTNKTLTSLTRDDLIVDKYSNRPEYTGCTKGASAIQFILLLYLDPHRDGTGIRQQFLAENGRGHIIVEPRFLGDSALQVKRAFLGLGFIPNPVPEFLQGSPSLNSFFAKMITQIM